MGGKNCLTNFHGMGLTTDKLRSMVKKWQTLIEGNVDVKTTDGYTLRLFCIGFTRKQDMSTKKTCYAQAQQVRNIRKVKVMRRPRFDLTKLMDMHGEGSGKATVSTDPVTGEVVERPEGYEPPVMETVYKFNCLRRSS